MGDFIFGELEAGSRNWDCGVAAVTVKKNKLSTTSINIQGGADSQLSEADELNEQDEEAPRRTRPGNAYHNCRGRFMLHSPVSVPVSVSKHRDHCRMHQTRHAAPSLILLLLLLLFSLLWLLYGSCFLPTFGIPNFRMYK